MPDKNAHTKVQHTKNNEIYILLTNKVIRQEPYVTGQRTYENIREL